MIRLTGMPDPADRLHFAHDGTLVGIGRLSTGPGRQTAVWWNLRTGAEVRRVVADTLGVSPDVRFLAVRDPAKGVSVFDGPAIKPLATVRVGTKDENWLATAVAPGGDLLFTVHGDHVYWHALPGWTELLRKPRAMSGFAYFSPGGRWAFTPGKGAVRFWDRRAKNKLLRIPTGRWGTSPAVGADDRTAVVSGEREAVAVVWNLDARAPVAELSHLGTVVSAAVTPDGGRVLTGDAVGTVRVWDATTGRPAGEYHLGVGMVIGLAVSPDGLLAAAAGGSSGYPVVVWDL